VGEMWIWTGFAAAAGFVGVVWGHVRGIWSRFYSYAIVSTAVEGYAARAVTYYCRRNLRASRFGQRAYWGLTMHVRPVQRNIVVGVEVIGQHGVLFWKGWRPIWLTQGGSRGTNASSGDSGIAPNPTSLRLTFFRGAWNIDQLLVEALDQYNDQRGAQAAAGSRGRFRIEQMVGRSSRRRGITDDNPAKDTPSSSTLRTSTSGPRTGC